MNVKKFAVVATSILILTVFTTTTFAEGRTDFIGRPTMSPRASDRPEGSSRGNDNNGIRGRLLEERLRSCQSRENGIKTRSLNLTSLVNDMFTKFDAIATRIESYYTGTVVPSGKIVTNYAALVADIEAKKVATQTALVTAQNGVNSFSCTSSDPKEQMTTYRKDMQTVKDDLKNYRTSIKNLIVAVHGLTGDDKTNANPRPTRSPNIHSNNEN